MVRVNIHGRNGPLNLICIIVKINLTKYQSSYDVLGQETELGWVWKYIYIYIKETVLYNIISGFMV